MTARFACSDAVTIPVHSSRLVLRPVESGDAEGVLRLAGDAEVANRTLSIPHPMASADAAEFIAGCRIRMAGGRALVLAVVEKRTSALIGMIGVEWKEDRSRAEVGYWLGRDHWGQGLMSEALASLLPLLFEGLRLDVVEASAFDDNPASQRVLEKCGFARLGRRVQEAPVRGRLVALDDFALSRDDWRERCHRPRPMVLVAAVALIDDEGRILMARRPPGKPMAGLWEFPGGKVKDGETPEAALVRELKEELDIEVAPTCLSPLTFASHAYDSFHLLMPLFACRVWSGQPRPVEGQEIRWVRPSRLGDLPMPAADVPLVPLVQDLV